MNIYRKFISAASVLLMILFFLSCGGSEISGVFIPKGKSRVQSIEFKHGNARFTDSFLEIKQGRMEFDVKGDLVRIKDPIIGYLLFKIIDADTLACEIPGMSGLYVRQK